MHMLRILLIAVAALGVTWAAEQVVRSAVQDGVPVLTQVETGGRAPAAGTGEQAEPEAGTPPAIPEMSTEDMEDELARIEAAVAGAEDEDLEEFTPSKPLAADLAIALPSDI
ncbi:MAG: hypothetical protein JSV45_11345 [Chromatiales bacterium]|nr:MAG: hypothetical protein JSV45_11345 [Chromatiales bacterium]